MQDHEYTPSHAAFPQPLRQLRPCLVIPGITLCKQNAGSWSPLLQEALSLGPSNSTMPAVPDAACYQLAMECCVSRGRNDEALSLLSEMEGRGLHPNEAALRALIRGFASEGRGGVGEEAEELRWNGIQRALGVFEELAERFRPPSR